MNNVNEFLPDKLFYKFQILQSLPGNEILLSDLDSNGLTEIITIQKSLTSDQSHSFVMFHTFQGKIIEQVNFPGKIVDSVFPLDYNHDGILEIIVPYIRNDSLFVSFVNKDGQKLLHFFLIDGKPRIIEKGTFSWDPMVRGFYIQDLDRDGDDELITVMTTGYARLPRGILVHSLPSGQLIDQKIIGTAPRENFFDDFDGDGNWEILCLGMAPNNGAVAGGFDDQHSYLIRCALHPEIKVLHSEPISEKYSNYVLHYLDVDGDGKKELMGNTESNAERGMQSVIVELNPVSFLPLRKRSFNPPFFNVCYLNIDTDLPLEIIGVRSRNELVILDDNFKEINRKRFRCDIEYLQILPDIDNDGNDEIVVQSANGFFLLNSELEIEAFLPDQRYTGIMNHAYNKPPYLISRSKDRFHIIELINNPDYWFNRYAQPAFLLLIIIFLMIWGKIHFEMRRKYRFSHQLQSLILENDQRGILIFDTKQRIHTINKTLQNWLGLAPISTSVSLLLSETLKSFPEILNFINSSINQLPELAEKNIKLTLHNKNRKVKLKIEPIQSTPRCGSCWLVIFIDSSNEEETKQAEVWCKMAQKTAHDIKNPLTAIMLKLQSLQKHLLTKFPAASSEFDPYFSRIIERIESLRRISQNFMKFINIETLNFIHTDIDAFLSDMFKLIQPTLPADIQLEFNGAINLPLIKIDHDTMRSAIENLISNAINAMPEGGEITISTQLLENLTFANNGQQARDYILIEVSDTGIGIPIENLAHIFEPGFTTSEGGNGLGLTAVKKIIKDHDGHIEVESDPGTGTVFSLYIPVN
ncbi:hypothetical protein JW964_28810 [candidate division KSB1 bacterium]|nr:hypothetical protein [candidate division KSB1 bacterium]